MLVCLLATACSDGSDVDPEGGASAEPTTAEPAPEPLVAGSGAGIDPGDTDAWCGAITPEQLSAATGYDVVAIELRGSGLTVCRAELAEPEVDIWWGSEGTGRSFEQLEASWERPAGVYDPTTITLGSGQPAVVALQDVPPTAFASTVVDGTNVQALVSALVEQDGDPADLATVAEQVLAVYVG